MTARGVLFAFVALVALAGASFGLSFVDLRAWSVPVALAIGCIKASIVCAVFMELREARASAWLALATAVAFLLLVALLVVAERSTRDTPPLTPRPSIAGQP